MKVLSKRGFKLPRLGKDKFVELMRKSGIGYEDGCFFVKDYNNVERTMNALFQILSEEVAFNQTCVLCGEEFQCLNCKHYDVCATHDLPLNCICYGCRLKPNLYDMYVSRFKEE